MKQHSCGGVLYTIINHTIYIVLGKEGSDYYHFKGCKMKNETFEEAAIREIYEETMALIKLKEIKLLYNELITKRKHYHLGLVKVNKNLANKFKKKKQIENVENNLKDKPEYKEKKNIKYFKLDEIFKNNLHYVTIMPILFYYNYLKKLQNKLQKKNTDVIIKIIYPI